MAVTENAALDYCNGEMEGTILIPLYPVRGVALFALVDEDDVSLVEGYRWNVRRAGRRGETLYALSSEWASPGRQRNVWMHRLILPCEAGMTVDHINRNGLDNRRSNLRIATHAENVNNQVRRSSNSSGFKGVYWKKEHNAWLSQIRSGGRSWFLGYFSDPVLAAIAYDQAAQALHGEFARVNFPLECERAA